MPGDTGQATTRSTSRSDGDPTGRLRIGVLGTLTVDGARDLSRASHRRLLAIMLIDAGERIQLATMIERFWPTGVPTNAKGTLHTHVSALRRLLPCDVITTSPGGYRVPVELVRLDALEFVELVRTAQASSHVGDWVAVVGAAETALGMWRGEPFAELADDAFACPQITRLRELRLQVIELRAEALLELGRARDAIADLEWATRSFPLRESLSSLLALARSQTGAHADALRALRATEAALADIGLRPSPALHALEQRILTHRPHAVVREALQLVDQRRSA
jgi:DNA-binding SARP family transcriptional activator